MIQIYHRAEHEQNDNSNDSDFGFGEFFWTKSSGNIVFSTKNDVTGNTKMSNNLYVTDVFPYQNTNFEMSQAYTHGEHEQDDNSNALDFLSGVFFKIKTTGNIVLPTKCFVTGNSYFTNAIMCYPTFSPRKTL